MTLSQATEALVDELASLGRINERSKILDIGCGIGAPAFYLHQKYRCKIVGISTSKHGICLASSRATEIGIDDKVEFVQADGTRTGFTRDAFDVVWALESSHLMNKKKLFLESYRVLKPGGQLLLCDLMLTRKPKILEQIKKCYRFRQQYITGFRAVKAAFARGKIATLSQYCSDLVDARFSAIEVVDISNKVVPTFARWRANMIDKQTEVSRTLSQDDIRDFFSACIFLKYLFLTGVLGYGLIKAIKN